MKDQIGNNFTSSGFFASGRGGCVESRSAGGGDNRNRCRGPRCNPASAVSVAGANGRDRRDDRRSKKKKPVEIERKKIIGSAFEGAPKGGPFRIEGALRNVR